MEALLVLTNVLAVPFLSIPKMRRSEIFHIMCDTTAVSRESFMMGTSPQIAGWHSLMGPSVPC